LSGAPVITGHTNILCFVQKKLDPNSILFSTRK